MSKKIEIKVGKVIDHADTNSMYLVAAYNTPNGYRMIRPETREETPDEATIDEFTNSVTTLMKWIQGFTSDFLEANIESVKDEENIVIGNLEYSLTPLLDIEVSQLRTKNYEY